MATEHLYNELPFIRHSTMGPRNSIHAFNNYRQLLFLISTFHASAQTLPASCTPACANLQDVTTLAIPILSATDCVCPMSQPIQACIAYYATLNPSFAQYLGSLSSACAAAENSPPPPGPTPQQPQQPKCPFSSGPVSNSHHFIFLVLPVASSYQLNFFPAESDT